MARVNYSFAKRQKEIAKKKKQEEKRQRKLEGKPDPVDERPDLNAVPGSSMSLDEIPPPPAEVPPN